MSEQRSGVEKTSTLSSSGEYSQDIDKKFNNPYNEIISRSVPWGRDKVGGDAQAMVTGDDGYFVNEQAAAFIA